MGLLLELAGRDDLPRPMRVQWSRLQYTLDDLQTLDITEMERLDLAAIVEEDKAKRGEKALAAKKGRTSGEDPWKSSAEEEASLDDADAEAAEENARAKEKEKVR